MARSPKLKYVVTLDDIQRLDKLKGRAKIGSDTTNKDYEFVDVRVIGVTFDGVLLEGWYNGKRYTAVTKPSYIFWYFNSNAAEATLLTGVSWSEVK